MSIPDARDQQYLYRSALIQRTFPNSPVATDNLHPCTSPGSLSDVAPISPEKPNQAWHCAEHFQKPPAQFSTTKKKNSFISAPIQPRYLSSHYRLILSLLPSQTSKRPIATNYAATLDILSTHDSLTLCWRYHLHGFTLATCQHPMGIYFLTTTQRHSILLHTHHLHTQLFLDSHSLLQTIIITLEATDWLNISQLQKCTIVPTTLPGFRQLTSQGLFDLKVNVQIQIKNSLSFSFDDLNPITFGLRTPQIDNSPSPHTIRLSYIGSARMFIKILFKIEQQDLTESGSASYGKN